MGSYPTDHLHIVEHRIFEAKLSRLASEDCPKQEGRKQLRDIGLFLGYEATRDLPPENGIVVVPMVRGGLMLAEAFQDIYPNAEIGHLGLYSVRSNPDDAGTMLEYLITLPPAENKVFVIVDFLIGRGVTSCHAIQKLRDHEVLENHIRYVATTCTDAGAEMILTKFPEVHIYAARKEIDKNTRDDLVYGVGKPSDKLFGTI